MNQSMVSMPKKPLGSAFDSELSEAGHFSAKALEETPKNKKERSQADFSQKSKKVVIDHAYDSRTDPIEQLRAIALLKEQQPPSSK